MLKDLFIFTLVDVGTYRIYCEIKTQINNIIIRLFDSVFVIRDKNLVIEMCIC